jgi:hypothetical protein
MIHHRQRLPLGFKPGNDLLRIHPGLHDLQRYLALNRLHLLGHEHDTKATFADLLQ